MQKALYSMAESGKRKRKHGEDWERKGHKNKKHESKRRKNKEDKGNEDEWVEATTPTAKRDDWMSVPFAALIDAKPEVKSVKSKEVGTFTINKKYTI